MTGSAPRILVVVGTPLAGSLNHALAHAYVDAARVAGANVDVIDLARDPIPAHPTARGELRMPRPDHADAPLDPATAGYIDAVDAADHLVLFFPQWWGTYPAAFKAWIDRVLISGSAFSYRDRGQGWDRHLTGRTARIVHTMDSPGWWDRLLYRRAGVRALRTATLWYCGIRTIGTTHVAQVRHATPAKLERAIARMATHGRDDARRTRPARVSAATRPARYADAP